MSSRPSRSSSIPIPRSASTSSSARNIESLISIPFTSPSSRQPPSTSSSARPIIEPRRVGPSADGIRPNATDSNPSVSPISRSSVRSASLVSSVPGRALPRTTFEPRVVRGTSREHPINELDSTPQSSTSPSQNRRVSAGGIRASGSHPPIVPQHVVAHTTPVAFEKPSYLEYSGFKYLLQTELSPSPVPTRRIEHKAPTVTRSQGYMGSLQSPPENDDDSTSTAGRLPVPQDQIYKLPTRWSEQIRHQNLSVSPDGRELSYHGPSCTGEKDASVARTNYGIPPICGIYYYEVLIQGKEQKAHVCVGFSIKNVKTTRLPGWEPNSWGYYGEDGNALTSEKGSFSFASTFGTGDIIGSGIDFTTNSIFFTKNGSLITPDMPIGKVPDSYLYPVVGLQYQGEVVRTNFGQESFSFDIDNYVQQRATTVWDKIQNTPLDEILLKGNRRRCIALSIASITNDVGPKPMLTEEQSKDLMNQLVKSYLVHHGYAKTARAFEKQQGDHLSAPSTTDNNNNNSDVEMIGSDEIENEIESRTNIVNSVLAGSIDTAIEGVQKHYPSVLETDDHLILFKLRCRKFVELILETAEIKKKIKAMKTTDNEQRKEIDPVQSTWVEEDMDMDMDVDENGMMSMSPTKSFGQLHDPHSGLGNPSVSPISSQYESALNAALLYGQNLSHDYQSDTRPECQELFKKTFGIVAWEDPLEAGGAVAELVGHNARVALAHELNQAILKSLGRPAQPPLETLYRQTAICINQLGLLGVGAAAYADIQREFIL